ncbi:uncharacterized protein B0P05DRAFT_574003 [Gilbertella persicaria]|uniref:uncharacterized protein n=1 Tax=Gilbertella persicaria TaxID=101096 RepID=UPI00221E96E1|nr:uncharacterized protein B0P05DRAFT_574003 [Gilbertella persicaria]KAI8065364.1 hypothetical protein B0P05DRAFT_574003 [Gilbertella persicaria]
MMDEKNNKHRTLTKSHSYHNDAVPTKKVSFAQDVASHSNKKKHSSTIVEDDHIPLALLAYKKGYCNHSSPMLMTTSSISNVERPKRTMSRLSSSITISYDERDNKPLSSSEFPRMSSLIIADPKAERRRHRLLQSKQPKRKQRPKSTPSQHTSSENNKRKKTAIDTSVPPPPPPTPITKKKIFSNSWLVISLRKLVAK